MVASLYSNQNSGFCNSDADVSECKGIKDFDVKSLFI